MQKILDDLVKNVKENIPGYIAISIAEIASGESLISDSNISDFDPELASAYNVEIINSKRKAMKALGLEEKLTNINFFLKNQIHIINLCPNGEYFIYLALDNQKANLAITKSLLTTYKKELNDMLRKN